MMRALLWPFLALRAWFLRWAIWEAESYLLACAEDGLTDSLSLREFRAQIDRDRVRLADVQARMRPATRKPTEAL